MNKFRAILGATALLLVSLSKAQSGTLDLSFDPGIGTNNDVLAIARQADGKILVGGGFWMWNGTNAGYLVRLNDDGTVDPTFNAGGSEASNNVNSIVVQPDGRILIAGYLTTYNGVQRNRIARLHADGSLDTSFDPGAGPDGYVYCVALQPDGKVIIGGDFDNCSGSPRSNIARLNSDGSLDTSFNGGAGGFVTALALQSDGRLLVGGDFSYYDGTMRIRLARSNVDGSIDLSFNAGSDPFSSPFSVAPAAILVQPDSKVVVCGGFMNYLTMHTGVVRLNNDGSADGSFGSGPGTNGGLYGGAYCAALQADGKVILGGGFSTINGQARNGIARLNTDGTGDVAFDPGTGIVTGLNAGIRCMVPGGGNEYLIGGSFTTYDGVLRQYIARIFGDPAVGIAASENEQAGITVMQNGASERIWLRTGFDEVCDIEVLNAQGQLLWMERHALRSDQVSTMNTSSLKAGVYMLRVCAARGRVSTARFVLE